MSLEARVQLLEERLEALESEQQIRACMNRYMFLCDRLGVGFPLDDLMVLFTDDAVWEGRGGRYSTTFGRQEGAGQIREMFAKYTVPPAHFELNVHFLTSEAIFVNGWQAHGSWVLLQTATFSSGKSQLSSARLSVSFRRQDDMWRIAHFQTESLFNRPVDNPWDSAARLPVPD